MCVTIYMSYIFICTYHSTYIVYIYIYCVYIMDILFVFLHIRISYMYMYIPVYIYICIICTNCTYYVPCHVYQDRYHKYDKKLPTAKMVKLHVFQSHRQHPWNQGFAAKMFTSCPQTVHHQASSCAFLSGSHQNDLDGFLELIYFRWAPGIQLETGFFVMGFCRKWPKIFMGNWSDITLLIGVIRGPACRCDDE